ncbi:MAG: class I fructose-bisphosphate aldolase [Nitrospirota bacterium]
MSLQKVVDIAIQRPALEIWEGEGTNVSGTHRALAHRARCNRAARRGKYNAAMETDVCAARTGSPAR